MKMHPGRISKAVFSLWDGKERGSTEEELAYIEPYYQKALESLQENNERHPHNIFSRVCSQIKYPKNFENENL